MPAISDIHGKQHINETHRKRRPSKACIRLAAAGAAVAAVAACGSTSGSAADVSSGAGGAGQAPARLVAASVGRTFASDSAKFHIQFHGSVKGHTLTLDGNGVVDFADKKLDVVLDLPAFAGLGGTLEERVIGGVTYVRLPATAGASGASGWIRADSGTRSRYGYGYELLHTATQDPTQLLSVLRNVSSSVSEMGTEDVRGVRTRHFHAEVDLTKTADTTAGDRAQLRQAQEELTKLTGRTTIPADVYVDGDGRTRRCTISMTPAPGTTAATHALSATTTVDFYDFGTADPGTITAPHAGQVNTLGDALLGLLG